RLCQELVLVVKDEQAGLAVSLSLGLLAGRVEVVARQIRHAAGHTVDHLPDPDLVVRLPVHDGGVDVGLHQFASATGHMHLLCAICPMNLSQSQYLIEFPRQKSAFVMRRSQVRLLFPAPDPRPRRARLSGVFSAPSPVRARAVLRTAGGRRTDAAPRAPWSTRAPAHPAGPPFMCLARQWRRMGPV